MPGELKDPEQSIPYYYDNRYDEAPNPFNPGAPNMDGYLRSIAEQCRGVRLSPGKLDELKELLESTGYFHRNPGDESFRSEVSRQVKRLMITSHKISNCMVRKVVQNTLCSLRRASQCK